MIRNYFRGMVLFALLAAVSMSHAVEFKGTVGIGFDNGGDLLLKGTYTNGKTWEARANQGFVFNGGVVMVTGSFETQLTVGKKAGGGQGTNGSVSFSVVPVELMEFYRTGNMRLGFGITYQSNPQLEINVQGYAGNGKYKFEPATGRVLQIGWAPEDGSYSIDLRTTIITYVPSDPSVWSKSEFDGTVTGLYIGAYF